MFFSGFQLCDARLQVIDEYLAKAQFNRYSFYNMEVALARLTARKQFLSTQAGVSKLRDHKQQEGMGSSLTHTLEVSVQ